MYMAECGIPTDREGLITASQLLQHRIDTELQDALAPDLESAGLGYLPQIAQRWADIKVYMKEAFLFRSEDAKRSSTYYCHASFLIMSANECICRNTIKLIKTV